MAVRNPLKAGHPTRVVSRKCETPPKVPTNPAPLPGSRKLKPSYQKPKRKSPGLLLKGVAKRSHCGSNGTSGPNIPNRVAVIHGHVISSTHTKWVMLTKTYKKSKTGVEAK